MKTPSLLAALLFALITSCGSDDTAFLPLDNLCPTIAQTVCEARRACCDDDSGQETPCEESVRSTCDEERAELTKEAALSYDGERAETVHDDLRASTRACETPFALARFFEGSKADEAACKRDSECAGGACDENRCATRPLLPLCEEGAP